MNEEAKSRALRLLDKRDYSRAELIRKLTEKGVDESDAAEAVDYLVSLGFVDDARYAPLLVRRCAAKGYGRARAKQELQKRGIDRALWDAVLEELPEQEETIDRILRSRLRSAEPDRAELKRASDALLRRGFGWDEIKRALARYQADIEEEE